MFFHISIDRGGFIFSFNLIQLRCIMSELEENYIFKLKENLQYSVKGDFTETGSIEFEPPGMNCFNESSKFEQLIMGSIVSAGKASGIKADSGKLQSSSWHSGKYEAD